MLGRPLTNDGLETGGDNCHGFTSWMSPRCGGYSRELLRTKPAVRQLLEVQGYKWLVQFKVTGASGVTLDTF